MAQASVPCPTPRLRQGADCETIGAWMPQFTTHRSGATARAAALFFISRSNFQPAGNRPALFLPPVAHGEQPPRPMHDPRLNPRDGSAGLLCCALLLMAALAGGCRTAPPLAPADFSASGWRVQQGQAVWRLGKSRPELAGEILLATQTNGNFLVQFTKTPFALASARVTDGQWQIDFGGGQRRFAGRSQPPARFVWFQLPRALAGGPLKSPWRLTRPTTDSWRLENWFTGEMLEGAFFP